jgi:hypothetical protein
MIPQTDLDRTAQTAAQARLDAEAGNAYMRNLAAKWYEQGFTACTIGISPNDPGLFSPEHRRGYLAAAMGATPHYVNVAGLPALYHAAH